MEKEPINVLYLDDEVQNLHAFKAAFRKFFHVSIAQTPQEAMLMLREKNFHVFIVDQRMPDMLGTELLKLIEEDFPDLINILVTGYLDEPEFIANILSRGEVFRYIPKPWAEAEMRIAIEDAYKIYSFLTDKKKELEILRAELSNTFKAPIANLEGLLTLAQIEINDVYALKDYFQYMSESIESLKKRLDHIVYSDLVSQN